MGGYDESVISGAATGVFLVIIVIWFVINVILSPEHTRQASVRIMEPFKSHVHTIFKRGIWVLVLFYGFILYNNLGKFDSENPRLNDEDRLFEYLEILSIIYTLLIIELIRALMEMNNRSNNAADPMDYQIFYQKNKIPIVGDCKVCSNPIPLFHGLIIGKRDKKWINRLAMSQDQESNYLSEDNVERMRRTTRSGYLRRQINIFYQNQICMKLDPKHMDWLMTQNSSTQLGYVQCVKEINSVWRIIHYRYLFTLIIIIFLFQYGINTYGPNKHNAATEFSEFGNDKYLEYYGWAVATVVRAFCTLFLVFLHHGIINDRAVLVKRLYWNSPLKILDVELMIKRLHHKSRP